MTATTPAPTTRRLGVKFASLALVATLLLSTATGCFSQRVVYGSGGTGASQQEFNQWFILWGLVPLTQIEDDVATAVGGSSDFTVESVFTPVDCVINIFTSFVTIYRKSIIVEQ